MKSNIPRILLIIAASLALTLVLVFIFYLKLKPRVRNKPNIVLIMLDALRADHLGCYGYKSNTSPNIDNLAKNGVLFSNAFSQGGYTLASIPSIFTSKFPLSNGVFIAQRGDKLNKDETTLAGILKKNGYVTIGFTGGGYTSQSYGLNQGFDLYRETNWGQINDTYRLASDWLEQHKERPFFLFIHSYSIHDPFDPPEPFNKLYTVNYNGQFKNIPLDYNLFRKIKEGVLIPNNEDIEYVVSQYDAGINYCDKYLGELFNKIEHLGLTPNTIIILTSDHGEDLMDHGTISHGDIYDVGIHVPLIIKYPNIFPKNMSVDSTVRSIDILPTILDTLGLPLESSIEGKSMLPMVFGKKNNQENMVVSIGVDPKLRYRIALRTRKWKFISYYDVDRNEIFNLDNNPRKLSNLTSVNEPNLTFPQEELYNLEKDPKELNNIASVNKQQATVLRKRLNDYIKKLRLPAKKDKVVLDEETKKQLKSLGYLQ